MQVILNEDVPNLGRSGELVTVKDGYGRNYLIPRKLAVLATKRNIARLEHDQRVIGQRSLKARKDAEGLAQRLAAMELSFERQAGEEGKLFGSVTSRDIADGLRDKGIELDHRKVQLEVPLKALGVCTVDIRLDRDVVGKLKVWVVAKS